MITRNGLLTRDEANNTPRYLVEQCRCVVVLDRTVLQNFTEMGVSCRLKQQYRKLLLTAGKKLFADLLH
jgi:hypothetical protein